MKIYRLVPMDRSMRILWTAYELGLDPEIVDVSFQEKEQKSAPFLKKNPFGMVPVLEKDDGSFYYESVACSLQLLESYDKNHTFYAPEGDPQRSTFLSLLFAAACEIDHKIIRAFFGPKPIVEVLYKQLPQSLSLYNELLEGKQYFFDDRFTLIDIIVGNCLFYLGQNGYSIESYPNLKNYYHRLTQRPAAVKLGLFEKK